MFPAKDALPVLEVDAVLTDYPWEDVALDLQHKVVYGVPKDEAALVCRMGMKVNVHKQSPIASVVRR